MSSGRARDTPPLDAEGERCTGLRVPFRLPRIDRPVSIELRPLGATAVLVAAVYALLGANGLPIPGIDESFYKGVAFELATYGTWTLHSALGLHPDLDHFFIAGYPPLYMVLLAGWYRVFGFGFLQSQSLPLLLHWLSALGGGLLVYRLSALYRGWWAAVAFVGIAAYLRTDRPDPAAVCFAMWAAWLVVDDAVLTLKRAALIGLVWGASLLVQPVATVLYAAYVGLLIAVRLHRRGSVARLLLAVSVASVLVFGTEAWMYALHPEGFRYFLHATGAATEVGGRWAALGVVARDLWNFAPWLLLFGVAGVPLAGSQEDGTWPRALWAGVVLMVCMAIVLRPLGTYIMYAFPFGVVAATASLSQIRSTGWIRRVVIAAVLLGLAIAWTPVGVALARATQTYGSERPAYARAAIAAVIPPGRIVIGDAPLWTMLAERYEFYDSAWGARQLGRAEYVASIGSGSRRLGTSNFEVAHPELQSQFDLVYDGIAATPQAILGYRVGRSRQGYGLRVFRRRATVRIENRP